ncbi:hypothetical protein [Dictyobacter kobayashii]|uniref:hypothetical protein n=1 Tax=Dictyobacter kobayashii TaxID=2014872 RepID=UPI0013870622|nr:hypothetical protein [Dictyobacter kobayashii]
MDSSYHDQPFSQASAQEEDTEKTLPSNEPENTYSSPSVPANDNNDDQTVTGTPLSPTPPEPTQKLEPLASNAPAQKNTVTDNPSHIQPDPTNASTIPNAPPPPNYPSGASYPPPPNYYPAGPNYPSSAGYPPPPSYQSGANYQSGPIYPPPNYQSGVNYQQGPYIGHQPRPRQPKKQSAPLPLWLFIGGIVLTIALLIGLYFLGSDWAEGASQASVAALIIGVLVAVGWLVRTRLRAIVPTSKKRRIVSTVFLLVLLIFSGWARFAQASLHQWQGQALESQQKWQQAINEYAFSGEQAPNGTDIARTYTSWDWISVKIIIMMRPYRNLHMLSTTLATLATTHHPERMYNNR